MHGQNKSINYEGKRFDIEKSFIIDGYSTFERQCMFLRTCVFLYTRRVRFEIRTTQGVSPPRLTPSEWGKHTIVSSSHHEFSNDNGRRQVFSIPLSSSYQYYFYPRIFLSHSQQGIYV